jgi:hypothetical protein
MENTTVDMSWEELLLKVSKKFKVLADFDFLLFIIGIQERGTGYIKYTKDEKMDMINLARCVLFEQKGFCTKSGVDDAGWPQFEALTDLTEMLPSQREAMLKESMITYFNNNL